MFKTKLTYEEIGILNMHEASLIVDLAAEDLEDDPAFLLILDVYDYPFWTITNDIHDFCIEIEIHSDIDDKHCRNIRRIFKDILENNVKNL